jgi:rhodanese-related sulfurtransferase
VGTSFGVFADTVPRMTVEQLKSRLGADDLVILDVRSGRDWSAANTLISGAVRVSPHEVGQWVDNFPKQKTYVLYCA